MRQSDMYHRSCKWRIRWLIETGDIISYNIPERTLDVVGINGKELSKEEVDAVLKERSKNGIVPRPPRKGLFKRYTESARSAMEGAGY